MKKTTKAKIVQFFNDYAISYRDNGTLRLSTEVDQFIFLTEKRIEDRGDTVREALRYSLENLIVAPQAHAVRESITVDNALKLLVGSNEEKEVEVEDETKEETKDGDEKNEEPKEEKKEAKKGGLKKVGKKK